MNDPRFIIRDDGKPFPDIDRAAASAGVSKSRISKALCSTSTAGGHRFYWSTDQDAPLHLLKPKEAK